MRNETFVVNNKNGLSNKELGPSTNKKNGTSPLPSLLGKRPNKKRVLNDDSDEESDHSEENKEIINKWTSSSRSIPIHTLPPPIKSD